jgi:hypothetical protein
MRKMCTLITSKGTDIDENIANQNHATRVHVYRNRGILTSLLSSLIQDSAGESQQLFIGT